MRAKRFVLALLVAVVLLGGIATPRDAAAMADPNSCCVCTGCPATTCSVVIPGFCALTCLSCSGNTFIGSPCATLPQCPQFVDTVPAPALSRSLLTGGAVLLILIGTYQIYRRRSLAARAAILVAITYLTGAAVYAGFRLQGGGTWSSALEAQVPEAAAEAHQWTIDAMREDDGSLTGTITVSGSPALDAGTFTGQITGDTLSGKIAKDGNLIATVTGAVNAGTINGQFSTAWGETGTFAWDAPPFE
jgi:hypothetical protein